jgi:hypothetical protein
LISTARRSVREARRVFASFPGWRGARSSISDGKSQIKCLQYSKLKMGNYPDGILANFGVQ